MSSAATGETPLGKTTLWYVTLREMDNGQWIMPNLTCKRDERKSACERPPVPLFHERRGQRVETAARFLHAAVPPTGATGTPTTQPCTSSGTPGTTGASETTSTTSTSGTPGTTSTTGTTTSCSSRTAASSVERAAVGGTGSTSRGSHHSPPQSCPPAALLHDRLRHGWVPGVTRGKKNSGVDAQGSMRHAHTLQCPARPLTRAMPRADHPPPQRQSSVDARTRHEPRDKHGCAPCRRRPQQTDGTKHLGYIGNWLRALAAPPNG